MLLDSKSYHIGTAEINQAFVEQSQKLANDDGFELEINNVFLDEIHLKWGQYTSSSKKEYSVSPDQDAIVAHFCLLGSSVTEGNTNLEMKRGESLLFRENRGKYRYEMSPENNQGSFFEASFSPRLFSELFMGENETLDAVMDNNMLFTTLASNRKFFSIISEMYHEKNSYSGKLKKLYLESKIMELLLLQTSCARDFNSGKRTQLHSCDIEAIYQVKNRLDQNFEHVSIPELAISVGINQTKLKMGFKELFGTTIFEYLTQQRMNKALELLKATDLPINIIAETIGYKYSQHFSTAFQKRYGHLPSQLRR